MVEAFDSIQAIHRVTKFYISSEKLDGASIGFTGNKIASTDVLNVLVCFVHNPAHHACEIKVTKIYGKKHVWKEIPTDRLTLTECLCTRTGRSTSGTQNDRRKNLLVQLQLKCVI